MFLIFFSRLHPSVSLVTTADKRELGLALYFLNAVCSPWPVSDKYSISSQRIRKLRALYQISLKSELLSF